MVRKEGTRSKAASIHPGLQESLETRRMIDELYERYGRHALPHAEVRRLIDKAMGEKTLTEELYRMREE